MTDMKVDCLYGSHLGRTQTQRNRGVQVFTYKELEVATGGFNEANVIGRGSIGEVYRGVLSDGTLAAVKMLNRVGKQGERAFRLEVCEFIYYLLFLFALFPLYFHLFDIILHHLGYMENFYCISGAHTPLKRDKNKCKI